MNSVKKAVSTLVLGVTITALPLANVAMAASVSTITIQNMNYIGSLHGELYLSMYTNEFGASDVWKYSPISNEFVLIKDFPDFTEVSDPVAVAGKLYFSARVGDDPTGAAPFTGFVYDPASNTVSELSAVNTQFAGLSITDLTASQNRLFFKGVNASANQVANQGQGVGTATSNEAIWAYTPQQNQLAQYANTQAGADLLTVFHGHAIYSAPGANSTFDPNNPPSVDWWSENWFWDGELWRMNPDASGAQRVNSASADSTCSVDDYRFFRGEPLDYAGELYYFARRSDLSETLCRYSPANNTLEPVTTLNQSGITRSTIGVFNGELYFHGNQPGQLSIYNQYTDTLRVLSLTDSSGNAFPLFPRSFAHYGADLYFTAFGDDPLYLVELYKLDLKTGQVTQVSEFGNKINGYIFTSSEGKLYLHTEQSPGNLNLWQYNDITGEFIDLLTVASVNTQ